MKTKIIQPFKATINQTTIEHEWIFNILTSIIDRIETTFNVDVTSQFIQDLNDAIIKYYLHHKDNVKEIENELFNSTYKETVQKIIFKIHNDASSFNAINKTIKLEPSTYFRKRFTTREKQDLLLSAIIYCVDFKVNYGVIAPYTHGYSVYSKLAERQFIELVTTRQNWVETLPEELRRYLEKKYPDYNYESLKKRLSNISNTITFGTDTRLRVADGYEQNKTKETIENILKGRHQGDWSTMTPISQNKLAILLTAIKYRNLIDIPQELKDASESILNRIIPYVGK